MIIIPAIDIRHGKVVQLIQGDPENVGVESALTPGEQADAWIKAGATRLHVVDLDAALDELKQSMIIHSVLRRKATVQLGGGIRKMLEIQTWIEQGVDKLIIGTQGIENPEWLLEVLNLFPDRVILAVDAKGRKVVTNGWTEETALDVVELAQRFTGHGLAGFLYTNVDKEGKMQGIDAEILAELRAAVGEELIASGGFSSLDDLQVAADLGIDAVVLGMSIYTNTINLKEAVTRFA